MSERRRKGLPVQVQPPTSADAGAWLRMRCALWPEGSESEHRDEIDRFLAGQLRQPLATLLAKSSGASVGFVELSIRSAFQKAFAVDMLGGAALAIISAAGATVIGKTSRKR